MLNSIDTRIYKTTQETAKKLTTSLTGLEAKIVNSMYELSDSKGKNSNLDYTQLGFFRLLQEISNKYDEKCSLLETSAKNFEKSVGAKIEELTSEFAKTEEKITNLSEFYKTLTKFIEKIDAKVDMLEKTVTENNKKIEEKISTMDQKINALFLNFKLWSEENIEITEDTENNTPKPVIENFFGTFLSPNKN